MKKIICFLLFVLVTNCAFSNPVSGSTYVDLHALGGYPLVGIGIRCKKEKHGYDLSGNILPFIPPEIKYTTFHLKSLYLFYPMREGFYLGTGLGLLNLSENLDGITCSFEGTVGYQWKFSKNSTIVFLEANTIMPITKSILVWPGLTFGFGF